MNDVERSASQRRTGDNSGFALARPTKRSAVFVESHRMRNVTLRQLRAFCAVYELRSFTLAAETLSLTQSAVSRLCAELEEEVGLPLFDRSTRHVDLCDGAADLYFYAQEILGSIRSAERSLSSLTGLQRGVIGIASSPMMMHALFCPSIASFVVKHPAIRFDLHELSTDDTLRYVRDGKVDIGLVGHEIEDAKLVQEVIHRHPMYVVASATHALSKRRSIKWNELTSHTHVTLRNVYSTRRTLDRILGELDLVLPSTVETSTLLTGLRLVQLGVGISVVPGYVCAYARDLGLSVIKIEGDRRHSHELSLVTRRASRPSLALVAFISHFRTSEPGLKRDKAVPRD